MFGAGGAGLLQRDADQFNATAAAAPQTHHTKTRTGKELRAKGLNRIGNMLVPNSNYCLFEDWIMPLLDGMLEEQQSHGTVWTPSKIIARLGQAINHPDSVYYWAWKNDIPVFCPAITDGSIGVFHVHVRVCVCACCAGVSGCRMRDEVVMNSSSMSMCLLPLLPHLLPLPFQLYA